MIESSIVCTQEVTSINKQKFLAELGKLLTFMYDADRETAIAMYHRMFEEARDEMALIQSLGSPTKQAVVVARAYNTNYGKLSLYAGAKAAPEDRDENGVPDYVQAIEAVREKALAAQGVFAAEEIAEEEEALVSEESAAEAEEPAEEPAEETAEEASEEASAEEPAAEEATEEPVSEEEPEEPAAGEAPAEEAPAEEAEEETPAEESAEEPAEEAEEPAAEEAPVEEAAETPAEESAPVEALVEEPEGEVRDNVERFTLPEEGTESPELEPGQTALSGNEFNVAGETSEKLVRKPRIFLLIPYIILAIPLTICGIAILLLPAILSLALSVGAIICGAVLVSAAFKGFAVFADIMVLLGLALVLFALGLLFLWTSIWFIGGAIVGLVHGVAELCDKWCYKEVLEG